MEVHAHTHSDRKKWTHYFWEFLMLFLAVFCGFFAENQREHIIEGRRAKEYAMSLIKDLENDTVVLRHCIGQNKEILASFDSIGSIVHRGITGNQVKGSFYYYSQIGCVSPTLVWNNATLIQLTQSGNLRYFRNGDLVNKISNYYANEYYVQILNSTDKDSRGKSMELKSRVLKNYYSKDFHMFLPAESLRAPDSLLNNSYPLQNSDVDLLNEFANSFANRRLIVNRVITLTYPEAINKATELILDLKKEYHLK